MEWYHATWEAPSHEVYAHIVNLIVNDGIKELGFSVAWVRSTVKYVGSPSRLQNFRTCIKIERIEWSKTMCLDVSTRWNSTYLMLNSMQV